MNNFDGAKENSAWQMLISPQRMELISVLFHAKMTWISTSVLYYAPFKLYIYIDHDVKFISVDRQKLDLSIYIYYMYRKLYICRDTARFYEHKNDPRKLMGNFLIKGPGRQKTNKQNKHTIVNISLPISFKMCFRCSKERTV